MKKRLMPLLLAAVMALCLLPANTARSDTLQGLFAGKFRAGSQIFDCQRGRVSEGVWYAHTLKTPYARSGQFGEGDLEDRYFAFRDTGKTLIEMQKTIPVVGLYLFDSATDAPVHIPGKTDETGFVNEGTVNIVADEGIIYIGENGRWGYLISNAAGYHYGDFSSNWLYLRENSVENPTLEELKQFDASDILLDAGQILLRFYPNGEGVTNMPNPSYRTKPVDGNFAIDDSLSPSRSGYKFIGWNRHADGSGATYLPGAIYRSNVGLSLYAQWIADQGADMQPQTAPEGVGLTDAPVWGGNGALTATTQAMQYRTAEDKNTWYWCAEPSTPVAAGEYWVRYAPKEGYLASPEIAVGKVLQPAATPMASDFTVTHLTAIGSGDGAIAQKRAGLTYEWRAADTVTWRAFFENKIEHLPAMAVEIRVKEEKEVSLASLPLTLYVKQPAAAPAPDAFTVTDVTAFGGRDGAISVSDAMKYQRLHAGRWYSIPSSTIGNLPAGYYKLRYGETTTALASDPVTVTVNHPSPSGLGATAAATYGGEGAITGTDSNMEYTTDAVNWTACSVPSTAVPAGSYRVRYRGKEHDYDPSPEAIVTVTQPDPAKSATPAADVTTVNKTAATQASVDFTLTNTPALAGAWAVYDALTGGNRVLAVTAFATGATLTLRHASDLPAATYWVSVTEAGKAESDRLALTVGAYVPPAPEAYPLSGTVKDGDTGAALAGASVQLKQGGANVASPVLTNEQGAYRLSGVPVGSDYAIEASLTGYDRGTIPSFCVNGAITQLDIALRRIALAPVAPLITTQTLPGGTVGAAYSQNLSSTGDAPISWSLVSGNLPAGLTLNGAGVISGIPAADGISTFWVKAANSAGSDTRQLSLAVSPAPVALSITMQPADQYVVAGQQATFTIAAIGDGLTYQWYINRNQGGWRALSGAIQPSYTTGTADLDCDGFRYGCLVADANGQTLKSDIATLHVSEAVTPPKTGDSATPGLWLAMCLLGGAGLLALLPAKRKP